MKKIKSPWVIKFIPLLLLFSLCTTPVKLKIPDDPYRQLKNYSFSEDSSLISRVKSVPGVVMEHMRRLDSRDDYTSYMPDSSEMIIIKRYLSMLPELNKQVMKERMVGIYFIKNLLGSGFAEWLVDDRQNLYSFIIFNPVVLKMSMSDLITYKEKTVFIMDNPEYDIAIDTGSNLKGFMYILLHESAHVADYVKRITPYAEEAVIKYYGKKVTETEITRGIWKGYSETYDKNDFRKNITFYGMNNGPRIKISDADKIYNHLQNTPFVSLYSTLNWAEDFVELLTFYHLTEKLKYKFIIRVLKKGEVFYKLEPMKNPRVRHRFRFINNFYSN